MLGNDFCMAVTKILTNTFHMNVTTLLANHIMVYLFSIDIET